MSLEVLVTMPLYDNKMHQSCVVGLLSSLAKYGPGKFSVVARCGSFLPRLRDLLTVDFVQSKAEYMLCVDSDIGWSVRELDTLLASAKELVSDREFVAGAYSRKMLGNPGPICAFNGEERGRLKGAAFVGAGFMMVHRSGILRMIEAYKDLAYPGDAIDPKNGVAFGLWTPFCTVRDAEGNPRYLGEDYSFCERWRQMGGKIWVDPSVSLKHIGEATYTLEPNA